MPRPSSSTRRVAGSALLASTALWLTAFAASGSRGLLASLVVVAGLTLGAWRAVPAAVAGPAALAVGVVVGSRLTGDVAIGVVYGIWVGLIAVSLARAGAVRVLVVNGAVLLSVLACVDAVAWVTSRGDTAPVPEPYRDAPYWGEDFRLERKEFSERVETGEGTVERRISGATVRVNADYDGRYISITDGQRRTVGAPVGVPRILLFGGSTVLDAEVPDAYTIGSQLQAMVGDAWRVENYGVSGASLAGNVAWARVLDVRPGDIVVSLSGVNNVGGVVDRGARWRSVYEMLDAPRFETARRRSWLVARIHALANVPVYERDDDAIAVAVDRYSADLDAMAALVDERGARYVNFLQPHLWTVTAAALSPGERAMTGSWGATFREVVVSAYGEMAAAVLDRAESVDLRAAFDAKRRAIFFDWHHVNEHGNALLAEAIHGELERRGWLRGE